MDTKRKRRIIRVKLRLVGKSPLIMHNWDRRDRMEMRSPEARKRDHDLGEALLAAGIVRRFLKDGQVI